MENKIEEKKLKKGFWARLLESIDKKMEEKAKAGSCCQGKQGEKKSCCS